MKMKENEKEHGRLKLEEKEWFKKLIEDLKLMIEEGEQLALTAIEKEKKKCPGAVKENMDRIQALVRTSEYQKDYEELNKLYPPDESSREDEALIRKKEEEIQRKYKISYTIPLKTNGTIDFMGLSAVDIFDYLLKVKEDGFSYRDYFRRLRQQVHGGSLRNIFDDVTPPVVVIESDEPKPSNRYLCLEIDLTAKKEEIMSYFEETIDFYRKFIKFYKKTTRNRGHTLDIWSIYDLHNKEGLSFTKIAQKLSGINKPPTYNERVMNKYKAVRRAYAKAKELIDQERSRLK